VAERRGIPFVVAAPSGTGKTTVCHAVVERDPEIEFSVSHTTRPPREGERDGVDYFFVTEREFGELVRAGAFLEHAEYNGNLYGTSVAALDRAAARGHDVLLEIEIQGARQVRAQRADARLIFLLPPSTPELERRLRARGTDPPEETARRLSIARREFEAMDAFDYLVLNDDLERAVEAILEIVRGERAGDTGTILRDYGRARHAPAMRRRLGLC
jgi:guanylate kinase